jgi:hypothetical protein
MCRPDPFLIKKMEKDARLRKALERMRKKLAVSKAWT